jgi:hypothetical protein
MATDPYEVMQISRNADEETIHRVYRIMALRFHPDNPRTGDRDRFLLLKGAYQILSKPAQRARYDAMHPNIETQPLPIFELKDFVDGIEGEENRRLGVVSLLYHRRRLSESKPGISVLDLEKRMAFPREHLNFTLWYLRAKGYVTCEDNSDYVLTAEGVDYVEANSSSNRVIQQLLTRGSGVGTADAATEKSEDVGDPDSTTAAEPVQTKGHRGSGANRRSAAGRGKRTRRE